MATPRKTNTKTVAVGQEIASKSVKDLSAELVDFQNSVRSTVSNLLETILVKKEAADNFDKLICEKKQELDDLFSKEDILEKLETLKEKYEEAQREHTRNLKLLTIEHEDKVREIKHNQTILESEIKQKQEEEERLRRIALEEENRIRDQKYQDALRELDILKNEVTKRVNEAGSFDERVKIETDRHLKAITKEYEYKLKTMETEKNSLIKILEAEVARLKTSNDELTHRLARTEEQIKEANGRANDIAIASLEATSGKKALEKVEAIAQKQAESGKR